MWSLRILSGDLAGKSFELKNGSNSLGRSSQNDLAITSNGISKSHATIEVSQDKLVITDNKSTNGTFVDGVAIKSKVILPGQKIAFHDVVCEIIATERIPKPQENVAMMAYNGNAALQPEFSEPQPMQAERAQESNEPKGILEHAQQYVDEIIMPGAYRLAEHIEFKNLVMLFCLCFVVLVTALSTIPLTSILKKRIEKTSQQNAMTLAKILANKNRASVIGGQISGVRTTYVTTEPGVSEAYIIDLEGRVVAPAALARQVPDNPFIAKATKLPEPVFQQIDDSTIGASAPIIGANNQGEVRPLAYAVVMFDMSGNAVDDSQTFSLFIQTLFIALIIGAIVFFFLYRIVLYPITYLNEQVSKSLREGQTDLRMDYNFPELQDLIQNLQSALARSSSGSGFSEQGSYEHERSSEASGILNLIGFAAIAINTETNRIIAVNSHFQDQIGKATDWNGMNIIEILDQALRLNITDIIESCKNEPNQVAHDDLEIEGTNYEISGQAVYGSNDVNYVIVTFTPSEGLI